MVRRLLAALLLMGSIAAAPVSAAEVTVYTTREPGLLKPLLDGGFHAVAHTMSGPPGVWAGPVRGTLGEAIDDAVDVLDELRRHD